MAKSTVLIIEDDKAISLGLEKNLQFEGYDIMTAADGERGLELAINKRPDLIILDLMLPTISGFEICKTLQRHKIDTPIIILSAKDEEFDKIMGLDLGADDYMTKPFSVNELIARINAVLRRKRKYQRKNTVFSFDDFTLDIDGRVLRQNDEPISLSQKEFDLLKYFLENPGKVLARQQILNQVWGYDYYGTARTIDNFITKLRHKIEQDPNDPQHIKTVRGVGYKFVV